MNTRMVLGLAVAALAPAAVDAATRLPARFVQDMVWVDARLKDGSTLTFWSDSGGGGTLLRSGYVARKGWATSPVPAHESGDLPPGTQMLADPIPLAPGALPVLPPPPVFVFSEPKSVAGWENPTNGNLGQAWWAGHIWTWDYPGHTLTLDDPGWSPPRAAHVIPVGFKPAEPGFPAVHHPRISVEIAGDRVDVLLDTGATTYLSESAQKVIGGPRLRACSMIIATRFERWRLDHPDWRYIPKGQAGSGADMIEVPDVKVAGFEVGPVWFTERPDTNFHDMMSSTTDKTVDGALGGNAYHSLVMTVDYLHGRAAFAQPRPR